MTQRGHRKCVELPARPQIGVTLTATDGRPKLLGLPYVVEMFRKILQVLCIYNLHCRMWYDVHKQSRFMDIGVIRHLFLNSHDRKVATNTVTVTCGRPRLVVAGPPYVVEMCRKILAVLCINNVLVHITKLSRQMRQMSQRDHLQARESS